MLLKVGIEAYAFLCAECAARELPVSVHPSSCAAMYFSHASLHFSFLVE